MGATPLNLFQSLSSKLVILVLVSLIFAIPSGWYFMKKWLEDYAYPIDLSTDIFIISAVFIVVVSVVIICFEVIGAIKRYPAENLHAE